MSQQSLSVRLCEEPVGVLRLHSGSMTFAYENAKRALSLSMPIREQPYKNRACEAFFGGLLPDAPETKRLIGRLYGINSNSNFSLLEKIGFDCAGAVSLCDPNSSVSGQPSFKLEGRRLKEDALYRHLKELPSRPLFVGVEGIRISLAGVQDKAALCLIEGQLCIPALNVPSTHILKPPIRGLAHSVENEYLCMSLAKRIGLDTPSVEIRKIRDIPYLLIERFDRFYPTADRVQRIHQEDFCQALGVVSSKKYQADGGPSLQDCFQLLDRITYPILDKRELLKRVIFNYIVANADCHAKNFSLLHLDSVAIKLAPVYDILCTVIYSQTSSKLAMAIGGESDANRIWAKNWLKFCNLAEVNPSAFQNICIELINNVQTHLPIVNKEISELGFDNKTIYKIANLIETRTEDLRLRLTKL